MARVAGTTRILRTARTVAPFAGNILVFHLDPRPRTAARLSKNILS